VKTDFKVNKQQKIIVKTAAFCCKNLSGSKNERHTGNPYMLRCLDSKCRENDFEQIEHFEDKSKEFFK